MAKTAIDDYSATAASNTDIDGLDSTGATGLVKSGDNYTRSMMAHLKGKFNDLGAVNTVGGTGDAITVTLGSAPTALVDGMRFAFNASAANTGATTLVATPAGGAAFASKKVLKWSGGVETALAAGDIPAANAIIEVVYDAARDTAAGAFMLVDPPSSSISFATNAQAVTGTSTTLATNPANLLATRQLLNGVPFNLGIACSVGSSALTIALKGADGNDPSATNPVEIPFRSATATNGTLNVLQATAATSLVISSGSTLGAPTSSTPFKVWVVAFNDAGTLRLGAIIPTSFSGGILTQRPLSEGSGIASSTAEGGAGGADSVQTFYTGTAVTSKAYTILAVLSYESGLATAGTWASTPTVVQLYGPHVPLPGSVVRKHMQRDSATASGTTAIPIDDTIPQITEGTQFMTRSMTPTSAANILRVCHSATYTNTAIDYVTVALFRDAGADALAANASYLAAANGTIMGGLEHFDLAGAAVSTTYRIRAGANGGGTVRINAYNGARVYGGVASGFMSIEEIAT
jgi:hypothetical protein